MMHAHNEYIQTGFEMGLQTVALIAAYLVWFGVMVWRRTLRSAPCALRIVASGMAALAVSCLGWHTFHIAPLALLGAAWLGMARKELG